VYDRIDPIGTWREDSRFAKLEALIQNLVSSIYCSKGETPKLVTPEDLMPDWTGEKKQQEEKTQSVEEMKAIFMSIAREQNKKVERLNMKTPPPKKKGN
jgi:hypothetical protein